MTIDTAIDIIENPTDYFPKDIEETKHFMVETMRKYQKIEQIVKAWNDMNSFDSMVQISEVVENDK